MANIALITANRVEVVETTVQMTLPAAETITPGQAVRIDTTTGKFTAANGTAAGEARIWGIAVGTHQVTAGLPVTAIRIGVLDGFTFSQAYDAAIYLSDTDGRLADAAGTVSVIVGRIIPGNAEVLGTAMTKIMQVHVTA